MNLQQQADKIITDAKAQLDALTKEYIAKQQKPVQFVPDYGQQYWFINAGGYGSYLNVNSKTNKYHIATGNCYETEEQCQHARDMIDVQIAYHALVREINSEQECPADFCGSKKIFKRYALYYDISGNKLMSERDLVSKSYHKAEYTYREMTEDEIDSIPRLKEYIKER